MADHDPQSLPHETVPESVLVVEDNWLVAVEVTTWLKAAGFKVVGPAAQLALARELAQKPLDYAVVDLNVGGERADSLIEDLCERGVKVIVLSGYSPSHVLRDCVAASLMKPTTKDELLGALGSAARLAAV